VFAQSMREAGIEVIDTDQLAKEIMQTDPSVRERIIALLGPSAYTSSGLDRKFIADRIFGDDTRRHALEAIVHPAVSAELERRFTAAEAGAIVAAESALILQTDLMGMFDYVILVEAGEEAALSRLGAAGKMTEEDARRRLAGQSYDRSLRQTVDISISNDGTIEEFHGRAQSVIGLLKALADRDLPDVPLHSIDDDDIEEEGDGVSESVDDAGPIQ
jgi:dephospho-CoA kinase